MEPVTTTTYVKHVEALRSDTGRVTFVRVELATGHSYTAKPDEAPKAGDWLDVVVRPQHPALFAVEPGAVR